MSFTIAITGKGGVGKTTVAGLVVSRLIAAGRKPVLAVDADPNTCLDTVLGVAVKQTVGSAREEARIIAGKGLGAGISKQDLLEIKIAESLVEADDWPAVYLDHRHAHLPGPAHEIARRSRVATHVHVPERDAAAAQIGLCACAPDAGRRGKDDDAVRSNGRRLLV